MANSETSSPCMNSSTSTSAPAGPKRLRSSMSSMALSASPSVLQTITPLPAASPDALTTTGAPKRRAAAFAPATLVWTSARAVGMPSSRSSCLANAFEVSISAAARVGPKIGSPVARKRSTIPASSGASGPTMVRSTARSRARRSRRSMSSTLIGTHSPSSAIPGFPGAAISSSSGSSRVGFHARASSRPPPPMRSTRTRRKIEARSEVRGSTRPRVRHEIDLGKRWLPEAVWDPLTPGPADYRPSALERVRERVPCAIERVAHARHRLVGLARVVVGRVGEVVLQSRAVLAATGVGAGQNELVGTASAPALELSGAHRVEWVLAERRVDQLEDPVPRVATRLVGDGLAHELVDAGRIAVVGPAGELHERALCHEMILHGEQAGAIGGQLALAVPLEQRELEGEQRDADREGERAGADREQHERDRAVGHVPAHDVPQLVSEEETSLVVAVEQLERFRVQNDEGVLEADRVRVDLRRLGDVELRALGPVQRGAHVREQRIERRTLLRAHLDGVGQEELPHPSLGDEPGDLSHHLIEAGNRPQRVQRRAIG